MKSFNEWLEFIESLHPSEIELGLTRVKSVAEALSLTQFDCPVITVTGTNGKGSVVAALTALGKSKEIKVGSYTSPHVIDFRERFTINDRAFPEIEWVQAFEVVDKARGLTSLTYFEFTTLAALLLAKKSELDLLVLEVGLGGRLDAVNVVENRISVVTSIGLDHEDWLGDTLEKIAFEKSGIIRKDSTVIAGSQEVADLISTFVPRTTKLVVANAITKNQPSVIKIREQFADIIFPDSFDCALTALNLLGWLEKFNPETILSALSDVQLIGRWHRLRQDQNIWLDVAHNPQAVANLKHKMDKYQHIKNWVAICGMLKDKKSLAALNNVKDSFNQWIIVSTQGSRGLANSTLANKLIENNFKHVSVAKSVKSAVLKVGNPDPHLGIVIFGSFLVVSEAITSLSSES